MNFLAIVFLVLFYADHLKVFHRELYSVPSTIHPYTCFSRLSCTHLELRVEDITFFAPLKKQV